MSYEDNTEINDGMVEAIEEGRIVKVTEVYAKQEGLPILRKPQTVQIKKSLSQMTPTKQKLLEEKKASPSEYMRKSPDWKQKQVLSELIDNFSWAIKEKRRQRGLTRTQLAHLVGESESNIKMLEFGTLPTPDFLLINKIQSALNINLRKDGKNFSQPPAADIISKAKSNLMQKQKEKSSLIGNEIQILDDEI